MEEEMLLEEMFDETGNKREFVKYWLYRQRPAIQQRNCTRRRKREAEGGGNNKEEHERREQKREVKKIES